jgi:hypothetical protein
MSTLPNDRGLPTTSVADRVISFNLFCRGLTRSQNIMVNIHVDYPSLSEVISLEDIKVLQKFDAIISEHSISLFLNTSNPRWEIDTSLETPGHFCLRIGASPSNKVLSMTIAALRNTSVEQFHNLLVKHSLATAT